MEVPLPVAAFTTLLEPSTILSVQTELAAKTALTCCVCPAVGLKKGCENEIRVTRLLNVTGTKAETPCPNVMVGPFNASPKPEAHLAVAKSMCEPFGHSQVLIT